LSLESYPHGSAQNIDIITRTLHLHKSLIYAVILSVVEFICDSLSNTCSANQAAKDLCDTARGVASSATVGTGTQADAFNEVFGIKTVWTCGSLLFPVNEIIVLF
jgi:hypothetical protein